MAEYIEREAVMKELANLECQGGTNREREIGEWILHEVVPNSIREIPAADVVEVRHGEWKFNKDGSGTCNQCGFTQKNVWDYDRWQNYCGVCGAKMDGKGE